MAKIAMTAHGEKQPNYYSDQFFHRVNHKICGIDMYEPVCTAQMGGHLEATRVDIVGRKPPKMFFFLLFLWQGPMLLNCIINEWT